MNFEEFKSLLEKEVSSIKKFELLEYQYHPYSFGSGILVYRIGGRNFKFSYDGRDKDIEIDISKSHEKYPQCSWEKNMRFEDMTLCLESVNNIIS